MADSGSGVDPGTDRCDSCGHLFDAECGCYCCGIVADDLCYCTLPAHPYHGTARP